MTRNELKRWITASDKYIAGYCKYSNLPYEEKKNFREIGTNSGIYGWNWTAYHNVMTDTLIVDGYRNYPNA